MKTKLSKQEKALVESKAKAGESAEAIARSLNMSMHQAYCSDDFCIAFSIGREVKKPITQSALSAA